MGRPSLLAFAIVLRGVPSPASTSRQMHVDFGRKLNLNDSGGRDTGNHQNLDTFGVPLRTRTDFSSSVPGRPGRSARVPSGRRVRFL